MVVKKKPFTTVAVLRNPETKGKLEEKKYYRSTRLLKFGS
jgi:hypothetical protein